MRKKEEAQTIFLDKDGALLQQVPPNINPQRVRLAPGAVEGLKMMHSFNYQIIVVSHQAGIAHGYYPESEMEETKEQLRTLLAAIGVPLAGFYYCPHDPEGAVPRYSVRCGCRKPSEGLLVRAGDDLGAKLSESWMIGDTLDDVEAGNRAGVSTVLLLNGRETDWNISGPRRPLHVTGNLSDAALFVISSRVKNQTAPPLSRARMTA